MNIAEEKKFDDCIELVSFYVLYNVKISLKLQDAMKNKFSKCEHIDIDWGVSSGCHDDDSIYQSPVDLNGGMRRSETVDNIIGGGGGVTLGLPSTSGTSSAANSPKIGRLIPDSRRRPMSQLVDTHSEFTGKTPFVAVQPNLYPPPSDPAPPPPPRTVSRTAEPLR